MLNSHNLWLSVAEYHWKYYCQFRLGFFLNGFLSGEASGMQWMYWKTCINNPLETDPYSPFILNIFLLSFIQHSMIYFFHHYELPVITQQAQVQNLLRFHSHQRRQQQQNNAAPNNEPPNMGDAVSTISSSSVTQNYIPWSGHAPYGDTLIWFVVFLYHVHSRPFWDEISIISPPASMCTAK